jgi:predicted ribosome-associated RNA-binding protein Tma20
MKMRRRVNMDFEKAINIAIGCVMASHMENKEKREVIERLRALEDKLEEFRDDGWIDE